MKPKAGLLHDLMQTQKKRTGWIRLLSIGLGIMTILQAVLLAQAVQQVFVESAPARVWIPGIATLLIVILMRTWIAYSNGAIGLRIAADAKRTLRARCLRWLTAQPLLLARQGQTGSKISVAMDAVDETDAYFSQYTPKMIEASIIPLMILVVVFVLHIPSGLILLFTAPFIPLFMALIGIQTRQKSEEKFQQLAQFSGTFLDSVQGLLTLKLFGRARTQEQRIEHHSLSYRDSTMGILKVAFMNTFALETIVMLGIGIVALELALQLVVFKTMHFHTAFLILLLVPEFYNMLKNVGTAFHGGRTSLGAIRTIEALLADENVAASSTKKEATAEQTAINKDVAVVSSNAASIAKDLAASTHCDASFTSKDLATPTHCDASFTSKDLATPESSNASNTNFVVSNDIISMTSKNCSTSHSSNLSSQKNASPVIAWHNLSFRYGGDEGTFELHAGSLSIPYGAKVAIVGRSGAGKTTLLHLLAGLLKPSSGDIRFNNQPLTPDQETNWLGQISYITQHPYIFAGTLAENMAIATEREVTRTEIDAAAQAAGLSALIAELENGDDTIVGEGGRGLSGGERQRLALARAFLKQPSVLFFDEPTTGLDLHTEQILLESMKKLSQQATVITIAHRLHTIRDADLILFVEAGTLIASGTHDQLLHTVPQYKAMVRTQRQEVLV
ncbi:ABC transporter ATP-binding protein/permease [Paenibacillus wenxiniae]|uniref:ABC transporter ATP-binding protein/permease n=1 Tax=Paenibacillus wenxiniae TaxID=1636843 RepID=A0ABW4RNL4_9BACL